MEICKVECTLCTEYSVLCASHSTRTLAWKTDTIACTRCLKLFRITEIRIKRNFFKIYQTTRKQVASWMFDMKWTLPGDYQMLSISIGSTAGPYYSPFTIFYRMFPVFSWCIRACFTWGSLDLTAGELSALSSLPFRLEAVFSYNFCSHLSLPYGYPLKVHSCSLACSK